MNKILDTFRQQQNDRVKLSLQFNRWSQVMIGLMIAEQEQKLVASDLPVDVEPDVPFWSELG